MQGRVTPASVTKEHTPTPSPPREPAVLPALHRPRQHGPPAGWKVHLQKQLHRRFQNTSTHTQAQFTFYTVCYAVSFNNSQTHTVIDHTIPSHGCHHVLPVTGLPGCVSTGNAMMLQADVKPDPEPTGLEGLLPHLLSQSPSLQGYKPCWEVHPPTGR